MPETGVRSLDDVVRRLVDVAEREDAKRRRLRGWVRDVPRFAVAALLAGALIAGLIALVSSGGTGERPRPTPPGGDVLGAGDYWYVRTVETYFGTARPSTRVDETWARMDGEGRIVVDGRDQLLRKQGFAIELGRGELTYEDVLRLPADPAALRAQLARYAKPDRNGIWLAQAVSGLLTRPWPVPEATRAAAIEALRAEPRIAVNEIGGGRVLVRTRAARFGSLRMIIDTRTSTFVEGSRFEKNKEVQRETLEHRGIVGSTRERPGSDPSVNLALVDNFAVFRRAQRENDIPTPQQSRLGVRGVAVERDLARRVGVVRGEPVFLIPMSNRHGICLTGGGCNSIEAAVNGKGPVGFTQNCSSPGAGAVRIQALLPDHAERVRVRLRSGDELGVRVHDNVLLKIFDTDPPQITPTTIVWDGPKRPGELPIAGIASLNCPSP